MPATEGIHGYGTILKKGSTTISDWVNITGPSLSMDPVEFTHGSSPDKFREFAVGLRDAGELSVEFNFAAGSLVHGAFVSDFVNGTSATYTIQWVNAAATVVAQFSFTAFITSFEPGTPHDDKVTANVTWKLTGKPTFTQP